MPAPLEVEVRPPSPYRLPRCGGDGRRDAGRAAGSPPGCSTSRAARSWSAPGSRPRTGSRCGPRRSTRRGRRARCRRRRAAAGRHGAARAGDRADALRARGRRRPRRVLPPLPPRPAARAADPPPPGFRPRRRPWPWEALAWAVVKQLIEAARAAAIQRRIVGRWGAAAGRRARGACATSRAPARSPAAPRPNCESMDLAAEPRGRAARGRPRGRRRPLRPRRARPPTGACCAIPEIGPWTVQCLGLFGRGEPDSLPGRRPRATSSWSAASPASAAAPRSRRSRSSTRPTSPSGAWRRPGPERPATARTQATCAWLESRRIRARRSARCETARREARRLARRRGQRVPRPDLRRRARTTARLVERLPAIVYACRAGRARALALRQPPGRGDPRLHRRRSGSPTPALWARAAPPRGPRAGARAGDRGRRSATATRRRSTTGCSPATARSSGSSTRRCSSPTRRARRSGTASSTTSPSARAPSRSCSAPPPSRRRSPGSASGPCRTATPRR